MSEVVTIWRIMKTEHVASCLAASGDKKRDKALKLWGLCPRGVSQQGVCVLIPRSQVTGSCLGGGPSPQMNRGCSLGIVYMVKSPVYDIARTGEAVSAQSGTEGR